ncbi:MAG: tetratricopeptide repeat protein [Candidatus Binatia bacterium]
MKRGLLVLGGIALTAIFALLIALNPGEVEFHPTHLHSFRPMLGVLLILTFCAGGALVLLGGGMRQLSMRLSDWRARRSARAAAQAAAWHQEGEAAGWAGELERSRTLMRKAWRRHEGNSARGAGPRLLVHGHRSEYAAAQEVLQAALEEDANDADLRYALGEALRRRGETFEAIRMMETLRVRFPRRRGCWSACASSTATPSAGARRPTCRPPTSSRCRRRRAGEQARLVEPATRPRWPWPSRPSVAALDAVVQLDRGFVPALVSASATRSPRAAASTRR